MQAITFNKAGGWTENLHRESVECKEPEANEVQIRIIARPINPSDQMFMQGVYRMKPEYLQTAGLQGAGVI